MDKIRIIGNEVDRIMFGIKKSANAFIFIVSDDLDIRNYFIDTFKLDAVFKDMVDITIAYINGRQGNIESSMRRWSDEVIYPDLGKFLAEELNNTYNNYPIYLVSTPRQNTLGVVY